jgi:hypothetical protein
MLLATAATLLADDQDLEKRYGFAGYVIGSFIVAGLAGWGK